MKTNPKNPLKLLAAIFAVSVFPAMTAVPSRACEIDSVDKSDVSAAIERLDNLSNSVEQSIKFVAPSVEESDANATDPIKVDEVKPKMELTGLAKKNQDKKSGIKSHK